MPLAADAGPQGGLRRRPGPQHRRHGRLLPRPAAARRNCSHEIETDVLVPTVHAMKRGRLPFRGVLYAGVMVTNQGPRVLEFNAASAIRKRSRC